MFICTVKDWDIFRAPSACPYHLCTSSSRFAPSFVRQPNGPERTQIVRNASKREFRVQWGGSGPFVVNNSDATSWHELLD